MSTTPENTSETDDVWMRVISEARAQALVHGVVYLRIAFIEDTFEVVCLLEPEGIHPWHELVDMEKKQ